MATLYIAEYAESDVNCAKEPSLAENTLAIAGSSALSAAFGPYTRLVRIHSDAICSIAFGFAPTATTAKKRLAAGQTEYFAVESGFKIAVISNT